MSEDQTGVQTSTEERRRLTDSSAIRALTRRVERLEKHALIGTVREQEDGGQDLPELLTALHDAAGRAHAAEDLAERLYAVLELKRLVQEAIGLADEQGPRDLKHALVMVRHGVSNTYAEDLTARQLDGMVAATARLMEGVENLDEGMEVSRLLTDHDLDYIPDLPDLDD